MKRMKQQASPMSIYIVAIGAILLLPDYFDPTRALDNNDNRTELVETLLPTGKCLEISSCKVRGRRRDLDVGPDKYNCYCDQKCQLYDDCCRDSPWARSLAKRIELGSDRIRALHSQWHCKRINNIFGDIVLRASCQPEWLRQQDDLGTANLIKRRCEYVKDRGKNGPGESAELDPIGMMMPITDLQSGVTYANSYCLRCNTLIGGDKSAVASRKRKLIYWSPLLECKYNVDTDERNTLYDLISSKKGQALQYSSKNNKWIIATNNSSSSSSTTSGQSNNKNHSENNNRTCSIMPTIPDSVEHMIRYCKANLIRTCPTQQTKGDPNEESRRARLECQYGHQSITYSMTSKFVYYNPACARCNNETLIFCEPKSSRGFTEPISRFRLPNGDGLFAPPIESEVIETTTEIGTEVGSRARHEFGGSGSFSVLMDLYEPSQEEGQVLANLTSASIATESSSSSSNNSGSGQMQQQCPDPQNQVYDPFYSTCRDVVCGLNHKFVEGRCVDKFKPAMVYITDVCLIVSITSLALYLILYALSTFDLRPLALKLAQWELEAEAAATAAGQTNEKEKERELRGESELPAGKQAGISSKELYRKRHSRISNEGSTASGPTTTSASSSSAGARHSQSLSTRGVASLAGSLLAAYLLFMLGHQTETGIQTRRQPICAALAAATYYCFLVSFIWMFLLAYDIWRTLRLATCHLRGPAMHSQSGRFLSYALLALLVSALLVGLAILVDQWPSSSCADEHLIQNSAEHGSCSTSWWWWWQHFVQVYRPNFGHQPGSCWFSNRRALALFFGLPVTLIMVANLIFFLHSSCMVIRTSSRSSRQLSNKSSTMSAGSSASGSSCSTSQPKFVSLEKGLSQANNNNNSLTDFTLQNSLTTSSIVSVQTLQSHLSTNSSTGESGASCDESLVTNNHDQPSTMVTLTPLDGAAAREQGQPSLALPQLPVMSKPHAKLDASLSSNSLATNHSGCSNSYSIASSLAIKYDAHLQSLQSMMGSIVKDYRLYCRLSTIMGLTWLTGLLASLVDQSEALWYLFVILNTLQGLFIFIAFGCKRSKLSNLELLFNYLRFWLAYRCCGRSSSVSSNHHSRQNSLSSGSSG